MKEELNIFQDDLRISKAKLISLEESPAPCTYCHFKGHKVSKPCQLPSCKAYHECGILTMHQEHKVETTKAKGEVKAFE